MSYDAVAFLAGLFEAEGPAIGPDDLPDDWRVVYDERAGIMEYEGGLSRDEAEALALSETAQAEYRR